MKIYLKRKSPLFIALFVVFLVYGVFILGFNKHFGYPKKSEQQNLADLHQKIDEISLSLSENQSFLKTLRHKFETVISKEVENRKKSLQHSVVQQNLTKVVSNEDDSSIVIPVVVFVYNRPSVTRCLDLLLKYRQNSGADFPIVVSQDGNHLETTQAIQKYSSQITHIRHPDEPIKVPANHKKFLGYYKISTHYKWAISETFKLFSSSKTLIIVEDDLEIAPDFFSYFHATYPLLLDDDSLYCVSAWNDNGKEGLIDEGASTLIYRSDFFPGLGWMLKKSTWKEMGPKWPASFWDDWIRSPAQRNNRSCIRPEIPRTKTFGRVGVSNGQFFDKHLKFIKLSDQMVDWSKVDLSYMKKENYDKTFLGKVYELKAVTVSLLQSSTRLGDHEVRVEYRTNAVYKNFAKQFGIMEDFKSGVPRMAYLGIVSFMYNGYRVHLAPTLPWNGYSEK